MSEREKIERTLGAEHIEEDMTGVGGGKLEIDIMMFHCTHV